MKTAFLFPGQGSQAVGMGQAWATRFDAARETFAEADSVLGFSLTSLCWEGPEEELQMTENTQPAILTTSVAVYRAVAGDLESPVVMAGHSLGEYSALVAAGALSFADALRLVKSRGRFMQEAVPAGKGAMAAILGLDAATVERIADEATTDDEVCSVANINAPSQIVVAGLAPAVKRAVALASEAGAKRAVLLPVSAPFHSPLMRPARERLEPMLADTAFSAPTVPVVANVDAAAVADGDTARSNLVRQIDAPVLWVESVERMVNDFGIARAIEIGPGKVLSGLVRRVDRSLKTVSLSQPDALESLLGEENG